MYYRSPEGWGLYEEAWSVKTLCNMQSREELDYESRVQRNFVWNKTKSSRYIHSLLWGMLAYNQPQLYSKHGKIYYSIDGKQRSNTLLRYVNNEYALSGLRDDKYLLNIDGEVYNINGKKFSQLPDNLKEKILDFQVRVVILEDAPADVEAEFFERANSGIAVSRKDIALAHNTNVDNIIELTKHELFSALFNGNKDRSVEKKDLVIKSWMALNEDEIIYEGNHFDEVARTLEISEEEKEELIAVFDSLFDAYKLLRIQDKAFTTSVFGKTNLLSFIPYVDKFDNKVSFVNWLKTFFNDVPMGYAETTKYHTNSTSNIRIRMEIINKSIEDFLAK